MVVYLTNGFSFSMAEDLEKRKEILIKAREISVEEAKKILRDERFVSAVGHEATAKLLSLLLNMEVPFSRIQIKATRQDKILVFQLMVRLEEGKVLNKEEIEKIPYKLILVEII